MRKRKSIKKGIALIIALFFVTIFSAISVGMFSMSSNNTIVASNLHQANEARACAESGLEVIRYHMSHVSLSGQTPENMRYDSLIDSLSDSIGNNLSYNLSETTFEIGSPDSLIALDAGASRGFYAEIYPDGNNGATIEITGKAGNIERTIQVQFTYGTREHSVFDFGVATKGPLSLQGNILLDGVNISVESDVYIESLSQDMALEIIGNSQIAGDVKIVNPDGTVTLQGGHAGIGGETGEEAIENHVEIGVPTTEFPYPDTSHFEQFVNGITIDSSTDSGTFSSDGVFENIRIAANTNPHFSGNVQLKGIVYIETPNVVTFTGNVDIIGIVVGDGDMYDNSGTNQINITGNVSSESVAAKDEAGDYILSDEKFAGLQGETGTFMMAPGFSVSFGGSFDTLNGCIAANGIEFSGNAGGEIGGSVVNYSTEAMEMSGNSDLLFNRSGITDIPAGFIPEVVIHYNPGSYSEIPLMN